jgi:ribulose-phosphate 3-epimerase
MTTISPSLLACDFLNIESELDAFVGLENIWFHLDIMDGHFVPNLTFGAPIVELISKKTKLKCDAHLMVTNPEFHGEIMKSFGLHNFTFHLEASLNPLGLINQLKENYASVGISIKPKTQIQKLSDEILKLVDLVLVMSVEPGFGGQSFMSEAFGKIEELKERRQKLGAHFVIQVDGGVSNSNARKLIDSGADNLVAGSYIFKNKKEDYKTAVESLRV